MNPRTCIIHGGPYYGPREVESEYRCNWQDKLTGRHFDNIIVKDSHLIPDKQFFELLRGKWMTRLKPGGAICIMVGGSP